MRPPQPRRQSFCSADDGKNGWGLGIARAPSGGSRTPSWVPGSCGMARRAQGVSAPPEPARGESAAAAGLGNAPLPDGQRASSLEDKASPGLPPGAPPPPKCDALTRSSARPPPGERASRRLARLSVAVGRWLGEAPPLRLPGERQLPTFSLASCSRNTCAYELELATALLCVRCFKLRSVTCASVPLYQRISEVTMTGSWPPATVQELCAVDCFVGPATSDSDDICCPQFHSCDQTIIEEAEP